MNDLIDVIDAYDKPTGRIATYDEVHAEGLFRRGVHIIVYTDSKQIVMQRRSPMLGFHPGQIEVSVGGGVDAGETPEQAAAREINEELGLTINESELKFLGIRKFNHTYKRHGQGWYMRNFNYFYKLQITAEQLANIRPLDGEADLLFIVSKRRLLWALRRHYFKGYGKFMPFYAYWALLVKSV